jgi:hypothetical protein
VLFLNYLLSHLVWKIWPSRLDPNLKTRLCLRESVVATQRDQSIGIRMGSSNFYHFRILVPGKILAGDVSRQLYL